MDRTNPESAMQLIWTINDDDASLERAEFRILRMWFIAVIIDCMYGNIAIGKRNAIKVLKFHN